MKRFKKCFDRERHNWDFIESYTDVSVVKGWLVCKDCPAATKLITVDVNVDGELISDIIAKEEEAYQTAEDDSRIQSGLN